MKLKQAQHERADILTANEKELKAVLSILDADGGELQYDGRVDKFPCRVSLYRQDKHYDLQSPWSKESSGIVDYPQIPASDFLASNDPHTF